MKLDTTKMINKLDETITIRDMINLMGGHIMQYPVIGTTITLNGKRTGQYDIRDKGNVSISYEWAGDSVDTQTLCRIYIGHKYAGPMLSLSNSAACYSLDTDDDRGPVCGKWEWRNLYSHGNFGNNISCGGNWASASSRTYKTATEALEDRDYTWGNGDGNSEKHKQIYLEGQKLLDEIRNFIRDFV